MYFQQSDLFRGMDRAFVKQIMNISEKITGERGVFLFHEGGPATHFFILIKGRIKLRIGDEGHTVYTVDHPGEAFGWSSLVGRGVYSATAEFQEPSKLLRFNVSTLHALFKKEPQHGALFFEHLAATLGNRLLQTYKRIASTSFAGMQPSYGTGLVMESETTRS